MQKIDANVIIRYMMNDHAEFSSKAKEIIEQNTVEVPVEVLCEVVYVLSGYYKIDRQNVSSKLKRFFELPQCTLTNREAILQGLDYFGNYNLDFVDCVLAGYADVDKEEIFTFDEKLRKLIEQNK
jgi:predicted nucleic-acid-binding protein